MNLFSPVSHDRTTDGPYTGAHCWCTFCEGAKHPSAVHTPEIIYFRMFFLIMLSIPGPILGALSAKTQKISAPYTPELLHFLMKILIFCSPYWAQKIRAPYAPQILYFRMKFLTFCFAYWGALLVHFRRNTKFPSAVHTWIPLFSYENPYICSPHWGPLLVHFLRRRKNSQCRTHLNSFILL